MEHDYEGLYKALVALEKECSLHGECESMECPLNTSKCGCIRNIPPAHWRAVANDVVENIRNHIESDKLNSTSCKGCIDDGYCQIQIMLKSSDVSRKSYHCESYKSGGK